MTQEYLVQIEIDICTYLYTVGCIDFPGFQLGAVVNILEKNWKCVKGLRLKMSLSVIL